MPPPYRGPSAAQQGFRTIYLLLSLPWLVLLGYLTHVTWFLTDDAFISFRYARNLLEGRGLVFNPGEYVEGYSNFLWVLELAALWGLFGLRPEQTAPWLSVACTVGTLAAMLWWITRLPGLPQRGLVAWMALGLVCSSATFAVWTSAGGLETRQFTLFIVLAVVGMTLYPENRRALLGVSLSLAAAALTRPEGPLFAGCCFGWYAVQRRVATRHWRPDRRAATALVAPFLALAIGHYLFRYGYYGEWLPNTYYAKHVRAWYEMGVPYLAAAAVETGLYLLVPLAGLTLVKAWQARRDLTYALPLLCTGLHMMYVARIGGDHFEYRPLDVYWPLLAVPAAVGVVHLGKWLAALVRRPLASSRFTMAPLPCVLLLFLPLMFYTSALQAALSFGDIRFDKQDTSLHLEFDEENAGWVAALPGMPRLIAISNALGSRILRHAVGLRFKAHSEANGSIPRWRPYRNMTRGIIPADARTLVRAAGVQPYFVPDLKFIDYYGLTDVTIARNPATHPNSRRRMGHERWPPPDYLAERKVNFSIHPPAGSMEQALARAVYAVQVGPALWMPFDAPCLEWVETRFEQFFYDTGADERFDEMLKHARLLGRGPFDVYLDEKRLFYVKDHCDDYEPRIFLHVVPMDMDDLPQKGRRFENRNFRPVGAARLGVTRRCVASRTLPDYPVASIHTGQSYRTRNGSIQLWKREFRLPEGG